MNGLIEKTIRVVCSQAGEVPIMAVYQNEDGSVAPVAGLEDLIQKRAQGEKKPAIIYGFESLERIKQRAEGSILNAPGVFYLKLPAKLSQVKAVFKKAVTAKIPKNKAMDEESFKRFAIREVRNFKHKLDNVWMSLAGNANSAQRALKKTPGVRPISLDEFKKKRLKELIKEYRQLDPLARQLGIEGIESAEGLMKAGKDLVTQISNQKTKPQEALAFALDCVSKLKNISEILAQAKEMEKSA